MVGEDVSGTYSIAQEIDITSLEAVYILEIWSHTNPFTVSKIEFYLSDIPWVAPVTHSLTTKFVTGELPQYFNGGFDTNSNFVLGSDKVDHGREGSALYSTVAFDFGYLVDTILIDSVDSTSLFVPANPLNPQVLQHPVLMNANHIVEPSFTTQPILAMTTPSLGGGVVSFKFTIAIHVPESTIGYEFRIYIDGEIDRIMDEAWLQNLYDTGTNTWGPSGYVNLGYGVEHETTATSWVVLFIIEPTGGGTPLYSWSMVATATS
jgi:hypothetical protein